MQFTFEILNGVFGLELPDEEECIAHILVCCTRKPVNDAVTNGANLVDENHDSLLEYLCRVRELPYITESENGNVLDPRQHGIELLSMLDVLADDSGACLTIADRHE